MRQVLFLVFLFLHIDAVNMLLIEKIDKVDIGTPDPSNLYYLNDGRKFSKLSGVIKQILRTKKEDEIPLKICPFVNVADSKFLLKSTCYEILKAFKDNSFQKAPLRDNCILTTMLHSPECLRGLQIPSRRKRGVTNVLNYVQNFMKFISRARPAATLNKRRARININSSQDHAATDFTSHIRPHLQRLMGKFRGIERGGARIGNNAQVAISNIQDSLGKTVSDIDGTIGRRQRKTD